MKKSLYIWSDSITREIQSNLINKFAFELIKRHQHQTYDNMFQITLEGELNKFYAKLEKMTCANFFHFRHEL